MVAADDVVRMRAHLFFEGADVRTRLSRFWLLLVLAAIICHGRRRRRLDRHRDRGDDRGPADDADSRHRSRDGAQ
jgi:hypothetical protein